MLEVEQVHLILELSLLLMATYPGVTESVEPLATMPVNTRVFDPGAHHLMEVLALHRCDENEKRTVIT